MRARNARNCKGKLDATHPLRPLHNRGFSPSRPPEKEAAESLSYRVYNGALLVWPFLFARNPQRFPSISR
jgi:hypothetical protein